MEDTHILFSGRVTEREGGGGETPWTTTQKIHKKNTQTDPPPWTLVVHTFLSIFSFDPIS